MLNRQIRNGLIGSAIGGGVGAISGIKKQEGESSSDRNKRVFRRALGGAAIGGGAGAIGTSLHSRFKNRSIVAPPKAGGGPTPKAGGGPTPKAGGGPTPPVDHYASIGATKDMDARTLKKTFREAAMKHHPDRNPNSDPAVMAKINAARDHFRAQGLM